MEYKSNMAFAIRTILLEKEIRKQFPKYDFTIAAGAVLNALSAVRPDNTFLVQPTEILGIKDVQNVLTALRNGLAHKIDKNFKSNPNDKNEIESITIAHHQGQNPRTLQLHDLLQVLATLEEAIKESVDYRGLYEEEKEKWDNQNKTT